MAQSHQVSIPERFLRQLWKRQEFITTALSTIDGRPVTILSPGTLNADAGPDFTDALVNIDNVTYRGDVELHQTLEEWKQHAHDKDARYNSVVLHVVFDGNASAHPSLTKSRRPVPVMILRPYLSGPFRDIWKKMIFDERTERITLIKCYGKNIGAGPEIVHRWVWKLAVERMELKVRRYDERLRELAEQEQLRLQEPLPRYGEIPFGVNPDDLPPPSLPLPSKLFTKSSMWLQLLYEGIFEALGFAKNREPFLRLAQLVTLEQYSVLLEQCSSEEAVVATEGLLFGVAGLLDMDSRPLDVEEKQYIKRLRSCWEMMRTTYRGEYLHNSDWRFFRLRPENFPTVRIAGAARLMTKRLRSQFLKSVILILKSEQSPKEQFSSLESLLITPADGFWLTHYHFGRRTTGRQTTLIGKSRAGDIVVNVVLPIVLLYARIFKDRDIRRNALQMFQQSPPLAENAVTNIITRQLIQPVFGTTMKQFSAMSQQGMLQLFKYYCVEERCRECAVGKAVLDV